MPSTSRLLPSPFERPRPSPDLSPSTRSRSSRPGRRTAVRLAWVAAGVVLLAGGVSPSVAAPRAVDDQLEQRVAADEATVEGPAVVEVGHVDLGARFIDGAWTLQARDDREVPPVWRRIEETVFSVTDAAVLAAPEGEDYAFLGVEPGTPVYVVPQVQDQDVVWIGWNTQDPEVVGRIQRGATLALRGVDGPGELHLFLQEGVPGPPNLLWSTARAYPQDLWMEVNTHTHANWVFTEPGIYLLDVEVRADLVDGEAVSDRAVLRFAVGSATDVDAALAAGSDLAPQDDGATEPAPETTTEADDAPDGTEAAPGDGGGPLSVMPWVIAAAAALAAAVTVSLLLGRRNRRRAEVEIGGSTR
ncbi:choice-of-anchor M domain-containing protein [Actinotalea sp. K2]|uniref:choice-of-anchor M domain-containing protein n=1 Tax=Actinotalea sp. K2 TaxID=2939438 RepID=UPI0020178B91|nr:choice-of-anchor M domain-containing protein [Actinotalea sp. K2]MCL3863259.1 choice-of-anchor M domain-containing protein [Actinotalea sp. K2]